MKNIILITILFISFNQAYSQKLDSLKVTFEVFDNSKVSVKNFLYFESDGRKRTLDYSTVQNYWSKKFDLKGHDFTINSWTKSKTGKINIKYFDKESKMNVHIMNVSLPYTILLENKKDLHIIFENLSN